MDSRLLITPFSFGDGQGRSIRRQTPVIELGKIIFHLKHLRAFSPERIEGKERESVLSDDAVDAGRGRSAGTLLIGDPVFLENFLGSSSREGDAHQRNRGGALTPIGIHHIKKLR